jgi:hypothetical protein
MTTCTRLCWRGNITRQSGRLRLDRHWGTTRSTNRKLEIGWGELQHGATVCLCKVCIVRTVIRVVHVRGFVGLGVYVS